MFGELAGRDSGLPHGVGTIRIIVGAEERRKREGQESTAEHRLYHIAMTRGRGNDDRLGLRPMRGGRP